MKKIYELTNDELMELAKQPVFKDEINKLYSELYDSEPSFRKIREQLNRLMEKYSTIAAQNENYNKCFRDFMDELKTVYPYMRGATFVDNYTKSEAYWLLINNLYLFINTKSTTSGDFIYVDKELFKELTVELFNEELLKRAYLPELMMYIYARKNEFCKKRIDELDLSQRYYVVCMYLNEQKYMDALMWIGSCVGLPREVFYPLAAKTFFYNRVFSETIKYAKGSDHSSMEEILLESYVEEGMLDEYIDCSKTCKTHIPPYKFYYDVYRICRKKIVDDKLVEFMQNYEKIQEGVHFDCEKINADLFFSNYIVTIMEDFTDYLLSRHRLTDVVAIGGTDQVDTFFDDFKDKLVLLAISDPGFRKSIKYLVDLECKYGNGELSKEEFYDINSKAIRELYIGNFQVLNSHRRSVEDIVRYLKLLNRAGYQEEVCETIIEIFGNGKVSMDIQNAFKKAGGASLFCENYVSISYYNQELSIKLKNIMDQFCDIDEDQLTKKVKSYAYKMSLTTKGRLEYESAFRLYELMLNSDYGELDAGSLSLAFYKIIEIESNNRIWLPLAKKINNILDLYSDAVGSLKKNRYEKKKYENDYCSIIEKLEKGAKSDEMNLMLGQLDKLCKGIHNNNDVLFLEIKNALFEVLTDAGRIAFEAGKIDEWYSFENRNKYRNPPAHTQYLSFKTAIQCKEYVESELVNMKYWVK